MQFKSLLTIAILPVLLTTACMGLPYAEVSKEVPQYVGKDLSYAIKYLGYPDRKDSFNGKTVYVWEDAGVKTRVDTVSTPSYSTSYTGYGSISTTTHQETPVTRTTSYNCKIRLITDARNKIVETDIDNDGCDKHGYKIGKVKQAESEQAKAKEETIKKMQTK